jgi:hypothetical protein
MSLSGVLLRELTIIAALCLAACSTTYHDRDVFGGVEAHRISDDTAQITARGNVFSDPDVIVRYVLRRAAEETIADGYDLFRVATDLDRTQSVLGSFVVATVERQYYLEPSVTGAFVKPGETLIIKMSKGPRPNPMPDGVYDAREVIKYLGQPSSPSH